MTHLQKTFSKFTPTNLCKFGSNVLRLYSLGNNVQNIFMVCMQL